MASSIEFKLFAPYNKAAKLVGSFSDWKEIPMEKSEDGHFRTQVDLEDGVYEYKFCVQSKSWFFEDPDHWVEVNDPYATDIQDANQNSVITIKDGDRITDTYVWQHDDHHLPSDHELVIYEMHVGGFSKHVGETEDESYQKVVDQLDYLSDLGVNAIEFMPLQEYPGDLGWGYNPRHFFATESSYGSTSDLKHLIDECHGRGIRVIKDAIYNHSESESPLTQIDHDYWYHHSPRDPENSWGPEFNYEHYDENLETYPARRFIGDVVRYWVGEYHIDGIRYDAARQLANYDFMHWITAEAEKTAGEKPFFNIAEHIPETPDITGFDGPMDSCWHESFYQCMRDHVTGESFDLDRLKDALDAKRQGFPGAANVINYLTTHDHPPLMIELANRDIFDDPAFRRVKLGAVMLLTAVGVPLIWMGEEFGGYGQNASEEGLEWSLLKNDRNRDLLEYYKGLIALRKENHALRTENIDFFHEDPERKVIGYGRWNDEGSRVVVVANFSDQFLGDYTVRGFPEDGVWHEWTYDYDVELGEGEIHLDLGEYEAKVFVWQPR